MLVRCSAITLEQYLYFLEDFFTNDVDTYLDQERVEGYLKTITEEVDIENIQDKDIESMSTRPSYTFIYRVIEHFSLPGVTAIYFAKTPSVIMKTTEGEIHLPFFYVEVPDE